MQNIAEQVYHDVGCQMGLQRSFPRMLLEHVFSILGNPRKPSLSLDSAAQHGVGTNEHSLLTTNCCPANDLDTRTQIPLWASPCIDHTKPSRPKLAKLWAPLCMATPDLLLVSWARSGASSPCRARYSHATCMTTTGFIENLLIYNPVTLPVDVAVPVDVADNTRVSYQPEPQICSGLHDIDELSTELQLET